MDVAKILEFLGQYDFVRLGMSITHANWNSAMMTVQKLQKRVKELGLTETFESLLMSIKQSIIAKDIKQAQDILAQITAKRIQLIEKFKKMISEEEYADIEKKSKLESELNEEC